MFLTQSNVLRGLSKAEYAILREMCIYSNNLYNVALYNIRQYYFTDKKFLTYESNCAVCIDNHNFKMLQAAVSQQILKVVDRNFKSFFNLIKKCRSGEYRYNDVKLPTYRKKGDLFNLILSPRAITIKDRGLKLPISHRFKSYHPDLEDIYIKFPERLRDKSIKEVRIIPMHNGAWFKIQYVYEQQEEIKQLNSNNILSVDLGIDNFATCVSNIGTPFIIDGRKIKSINQYWNKRTAYLMSVAHKQQNYHTKQLNNLLDRRNHRIHDYINKTSRYIINYCISNNIGTIVVGYNPGFKRSPNLGHCNNQMFTQIPFGELRYCLSNLCIRYGLVYLEQEESYTSKASALDEDMLPTYNPSIPYQGTFSGKRVHRGLYKSKNGTLINADVNGSANILRKCKQNISIDELCPGLLVSPKRIRLV